jgi:surfactin family lipopeptide synthetase A
MSTDQEELSDTRPLTAMELSVAELWQEVLQTTELPAPMDNFFALGGDSMAMVQLEFRMVEEFSVELPPGVVLGAPTIRELSALLDTAVGDKRSSNLSAPT